MIKKRIGYFIIPAVLIIGIAVSCSNPTSLLTVITKAVAESSPPKLIPAEIRFTDEDGDNGEISGSLSFDGVEGEYGISEYHLYWGERADQKLSGFSDPAAVFEAGSGSYSHTFPADFTLPAGATHFLLYSVNDSGESKDYRVLDIPDLSCELLVDIVPGATGSYPGSFIGYEDDIYFSATDGNDDGTANPPNGNELWSYNGSTAQLEWDIVPDVSGFNGSGSPGHFTIFRDKIYFIARKDASGRGLFSLNPKTTGFYRHEAYPLYANYNTIQASDAYRIAELDDTLYISAFESTYEHELYYFPIWHGFGYHGERFTNNTQPWNLYGYIFFAELGGKLYFKADGDSAGSELWSCSGPTAGEVERAADINPGASGSHIQWTVTYRDKLYFQAEGSNADSELWSFDGSTAVEAADLSTRLGGSGPTKLSVCYDKLYFHAYDDVSDRFLWEYDETGPPTAVHTNDFRSYDNTTAAGLFGNIYFAASPTTDMGNVELYGYDGEDVFLVKDINPGSTGSYPEETYVYDNVLYFRADDGVHGEEIWTLRIE